MFGAGIGPFVVDGLGTGQHDLFDRKVVIADRFQQEGGAVGVDVDELGELGHIATISGFVEDEIDIDQCFFPVRAMANVALDELDLIREPGWFAKPVGLRFEVVEHTDGISVANQFIDQMGADQACTTGHERPFSSHVHTSISCSRRIDSPGRPHA